MKLIAGVDIGNSTTEVCIASLDEYQRVKFLSSALVATTGVKGTKDNVTGILRALSMALNKVGKKVSDLDAILLNEAAPVVCDTAMETITETIITDSSVIGHNPSTPGGVGLGVGVTIDVRNLTSAGKNKKYIAVIPGDVSYEDAAKALNDAFDRGIVVSAAIVQKDEAVLICNRIKKMIPIVDEVKHIDRVPQGAVAAVEVASPGRTISTLSNPYGIASIFSLTPEETKYTVPIAKSLIGKRSAVVIRTPEGGVKEQVVPAGSLYIRGGSGSVKVSVESGAEEIMKALESVQPLEDVEGEVGTNVGTMIHRVKNSMASLTGQSASKIKIKDLLAIDTVVPVRVRGGVAGETSMEKAVAIAAMVKTDRLPMMDVAEYLKGKTGVFVKVAGVEAVMAALGALTTPGTELPLAILDVGGGSTDAAIIDQKGIVRSVHLAGAGDLVTMLINTELGLGDRFIAEEVKKNPVAKVESLFHIRMESGEIRFFDRPLNPRYYGRIVALRREDMIPLPREDLTLEKVVQVRRQVKYQVFVHNAIRALRQIAPQNNLKNISNVVMVGGSALDFEIPEMILQELSRYNIVAGRGNIRNCEGPRNAVATGLVMSYVG
ncbi:diol dehydratase reactivase subunit alpha [Caldanaerobius polysaccharolyticus]|uniref:diol dehydratase reactivase subunit alpha n=1 Tax=Caldanaerobius polysaccharolyticus TaxID=44256 RepID=UPI00047BC154|nr:diol dehydratase reactivase subunit alpha [Caldanaerobius polysaccharolyticus]